MVDSATVANDSDFTTAEPPGELIVSCEYLSLVQQRAAAIFGGELSLRGDSVALGLTRLDLRGPSRSHEALGQLRKSFESEFNGWAPPMALNHVMNHVAMVGEVTFGGDGATIRATMGEQEWPPRAASPGRGVRIGLADTQLAPRPWLDGGWIARYADLENGAHPSFTAGHATFVTGLMLERAPGSVVDVRCALDDHGNATAWDVAEQIVGFGRAGVDVLNLSFACYTDDDQPPLALLNAVQALDRDTVVVAAAGNLRPNDQGRCRPAWPAAFDRVVGVGASDEKGIAAFSPREPWVDIFAPGVDVRSLFFDGPVTIPSRAAEPRSVDFDGYARWSGTSFASAIVSGTIAAGVEPGRTTARDSLDNVMSSLVPLPDDPSKKARGLV